MKNSIRQLLKFFYPVVRNLLPFQVFAYLAVGAANTLLNIGLFVLLYSAFAHVLFVVEGATIISFLLTVFTGFWLSKNFAFTDAANTRKATNIQFGKYFLVALQGQFTDYLLTKALVVFLLVHPVVAYLLSTVLILTSTYFLQKYFTFRTRSVVQ